MSRSRGRSRSLRAGPLCAQSENRFRTEVWEAGRQGGREGGRAQATNIEVTAQSMSIEVKAQSTSIEVDPHRAGVEAEA